MDIKQARNSILSTLETIDKDKLSLPDLKLYAEIVKTCSEIQTRTFSEMLSESMSGFNSVCTFKAPTVSDMK